MAAASTGSRDGEVRRNHVAETAGSTPIAGMLTHFLRGRLIQDMPWSARTGRMKSCTRPRGLRPAPP
jgi:hypothetical protein